MGSDTFSDRWDDIRAHLKMFINRMDRLEGKITKQASRICALERRDSKEITYENFEEIYHLGFCHATEELEVVKQEYDNLLKKFGIKEIL